MTFSGKHFIDGQHFSSGDDCFQAMNPRTGAELPGLFNEGSLAAINSAAACGERDFSAYRCLNEDKRADFLVEISKQIKQGAAEIITRAALETALPEERLKMELVRTNNQLQMFADHLRSGDWQEIQVDNTLPEREPLPRPDLRRRLLPLGSVAVFGASNFPLAFSVAGGDTAAALAAGCPVVVKAHPAHPGTSELVAQAICRAVETNDVPSGVFSMVQGTRHQLGSDLVQHPQIKAVAFTGSLAGGRALFNLAAGRPEPIPVYAEMGSVNPVFVLPHALSARGEQLATQFADSVLLGVGQFCTNPGLLFAVQGESLEKFCAVLQDRFDGAKAGTMLQERIAQSYRTDLERLVAMPGIQPLNKAIQTADGCQVQPQILRVSAEYFLNHPELQDEVFGPVSLIVACHDLEQIKQAATNLPGQLTATLQLEAADYPATKPLLEVLESKAGRIIVNQLPTGVEVCRAMVHGGPYPATTDSRSTSVGTAAMKRFLRPVCYQNFPAELLPDELKGAT